MDYAAEQGRGLLSPILGTGVARENCWILDSRLSLMVTGHLGYPNYHQYSYLLD